MTGKTLAIKLVALVAILGAAQYFVAKAAGFKDTPSTVQLMDRYIDEGAEVVYFGDSTLYRGDPVEGRTPTLPEMLQARLPELNIGGLYHDAYNPMLYLHFVRYLVKHDHGVDAIVIPVNPRAFSPERMYRPEYQFAREKLYLSNTSDVFRAFYRPLAAFRAFDLTPVDEKTYRGIVAYDGEEEIGTLGDIADRFEEDGPVNHIRASYLYPLADDHQQIWALEKLAKVCEENNIRLVLYAMPLDMTTGEQFLPDRFESGVTANMARVAESVSETSATFLNLTIELPPEVFVEKDYPEAYLNLKGKEMLADRLAAVLSTP